MTLIIIIIQLRNEHLERLSGVSDETFLRSKSSPNLVGHKKET